VDSETESAKSINESTAPSESSAGGENGSISNGNAANGSATNGTDTDTEAINSLADKILSERLPIEAPAKPVRPQSKTYKHPMAIDLLLAVGLLFAMAGLTVSFVKTYITHSAKTSILQGNYKAAIGILHGSPIPEFFGGAGTDNSEDLLNQALYLDAMEKLDANRDDQTALQELSKVTPSQGSIYYNLAQDQFRKLKLQQKSGQSEAPQGEGDQSQKSPPGDVPVSTSEHGPQAQADTNPASQPE